MTEFKKDELGELASKISSCSERVRHISNRTDDHGKAAMAEICDTVLPLMAEFARQMMRHRNQTIGTAKEIAERLLGVEEWAQSVEGRIEGGGIDEKDAELVVACLEHYLELLGDKKTPVKEQERSDMISRAEEAIDIMSFFAGGEEEEGEEEDGDGPEDGQ